MLNCSLLVFLFALVSLHIWFHFYSPTFDGKGIRNQGPLTVSPTAKTTTWKEKNKSLIPILGEKSGGKWVEKNPIEISILGGRRWNKLFRSPKFPWWCTVSSQEKWLSFSCLVYLEVGISSSLYTGQSEPSKSLKAASGFRILQKNTPVLPINKNKYIHIYIYLKIYIYI